MTGLSLLLSKSWPVLAGLFAWIVGVKFVQFLGRRWKKSTT